MKNKLLYLILSTIFSVSFANADYYQPTFCETCWSGNYMDDSDETQAYNTDCGIYDSYGYFTIGTGPVIINPNIGIGYRQRYARLGWDSALSFSTIGYAHQLMVHVVGHYYFNPNKQNSHYIGLGLMGGGFFGNHKYENYGTLSTDFVFGKELLRTDCNRHFIEMHVAIPTLGMTSGHFFCLPVPLMYIKYGIAF